MRPQHFCAQFHAVIFEALYLRTQHRNSNEPTTNLEIESSQGPEQAECEAFHDNCQQYISRDVKVKDLHAEYITHVMEAHNCHC